MPITKAMYLYTTVCSLYIISFKLEKEGDDVDDDDVVIVVGSCCNVDIAFLQERLLLTTTWSEMAVSYFNVIFSSFVIVQPVSIHSN